MLLTLINHQEGDREYEVFTAEQLCFFFVFFTASVAINI